MMSKGTWYWLAHPLHACIPVQVLGVRADRLVVRTPPPVEEYFEIEPNQLSSVVVHDSCLQEHADMRGKFGDGFMELSEASLLHNLRVRFLNNRWFTIVARCLVYVNPFKPSVGITAHLAGPRENRPQIYNLVGLCHKALFANHRDQAIIVSGSAQSGRSDVVDMALECLTHVSSGQYEHLLAQAIVVLNAFCRASVRGTDSRRCALWVEMFYPPMTSQTRVEMMACRVSCHLLERKRVIQQSEGECNFNVFYHLQRAAESKCGDLYHFDMLPAGEQISSDSGSFDITRSALEQLGFTRAEIKMIFRVLSAILLMSRMSFSCDGATCHILESHLVKKCSALLGISDKDLELGLLTKTLVAGQTEVAVNLDSVYKAQASRDTFTHNIYFALVGWLISRINLVLNAPAALALPRLPPLAPLVQQLPPPPRRNEVPLCLGVLDMLGFEHRSDLDNLLANYANEQLHAFFLAHMHTASQKSYAADGLTVSEEYPSNASTLELLHGLIGTVEREVQRGVSDLVLVADISAKYRGHELIKIKKQPKHHFSITHYGGTVQYRVQGFVDRLAPCNPCLINALKRSELQVLEFDSKHHSLNKDFEGLLEQLATTDPHFVKCVQPNLEGLPGYFDGVCVLKQLHGVGMCDLVNVQKLGFPVRISHEAFCRHYHPLLVLPFVVNLFQPGDTASTKAVKFLESQEFAAASWKVGSGLVFMDSELHTTLEEIREAVLAQVLIPLQAILRGRSVRRKYRSLQAMRTLARTLLKEFPLLPKHPSRQAILELRQALKAMKPLEEYQPDLYLRLKKLKHRVRRVQQINDCLQWAIHFPRGPLNQAPNEPLFKDIPLLQLAIDITKTEYKNVEDKPIALKEAEVKVKDWPAFLSCIPDAIKNRNVVLLRNQVKAAREFRLTDDLPSYFSALIARLTQEEQLSHQLSEAKSSDDLRAAVVACGKAGLNVPDLEIARARVLDANGGGEHSRETHADVIFKLPPAFPIAYWQNFDVDEPGMNLIVFEAVPVSIECRKTAIQPRQRTRDRAILELRKAIELNDLIKIAEYVHELLPDTIYLPNLLKEAHIPLQPRTEVLQQMQQAREAFDDVALVSLFEKAFCLGLETHDSVIAAISWCNDMKELRKLFCVMRVTWSIGEVRMLTMSAARASLPEVSALLREASPQQQETHDTLLKLTQACVNKAHLSQKHRRQRDVAQSCRRVKRRDVRPIASDDERFAMHNFPALRDPADFSKLFFAIKKLDKQHILQFSDQPLAKSLTQLQHTRHKKAALQVSKSILGYMGDGPADQRPDAMGAFILQQALELPQLGDEILVQLVKQVTMNPNPESTLKGWELLGMAVHVFHPSNLLQPYFLNFLYSTTCDEKAPEKVYGYARYVMYKLKYPDLSFNLPLTTVSPDALTHFRSRNMTSDLVRISFPDGTWMELLAHPWHKASDNLDIVSGWLGIELETKKDEFALFYTQSHQSCPIDKDTCLLDLSTKRGSQLPRFDFRRRITPLSPQQLSSATTISLSYHDGIRYICEKPTLYTEENRIYVLACHQLLYDRHYFEPIGNTSGEFLAEAGGSVAQTRAMMPLFKTSEERFTFESKVRLKKLELRAGSTMVDALTVLSVLQQSPVFGALCFPCELDGEILEVGIGPLGVLILAGTGPLHFAWPDIANSICSERSFQINVNPRTEKKTQYYFTTTQGFSMQNLMLEYLPAAKSKGSRRSSVQ